MNKKVMKGICIVLTVMMFVFAFSSLAFATSTYPDPKDFDTAGNEAGVKEVSAVIGSVLRIVRTVAVGVAVIMLIVLAIKYISAAPSEKAEIKKSATIYVVGAVLLFAAAGVLQVIQSFALNIGTSS